MGAATVSGDLAQDEVQWSKNREVTPYRRDGSSFAIHNVRHSCFDVQHDETLKIHQSPRSSQQGPLLSYICLDVCAVY